MRSQASMPNLASSRPNDLSCSRKSPSACPARASGFMIGIHPSPSRAARVRTATGDSITTKAAINPVNQRDGLLNNAKRYLGDVDRKAPLVSPLYADLTDLPPLLIQVGESEVLLDDSKRLAERAKRYGVDVTLEVWPDMIHVWQLFAAVLPEARQAIEHIGAFMRTHVT